MSSKSKRKVVPLHEELHAFLTSSATNVERMSLELQNHLTISTGMEDIVRSAVEVGRSVVIAGTAGSGKTHLLRSLGQPEGYRVEPDLSARPEGEWARLLKGGKPILLAGNEGAFLKGKAQGFPGFSEVIELLHKAQLGTVDSAGAIESLPLVLDAAGFDPAGNRAIKKLLVLPLLGEYLEARKSKLQKRAWAMLKHEEVLERVATLIEAASAESEGDGFTFRQIWQFVSDLIEGPSDDIETWLDRFFAGNSEISRRIRIVCDPDSVAMPGIANRLWYADLSILRKRFLTGCVPALEDLLAVEVDSLEARRRRFGRARLVALLGLRDSPIDQLFEGGTDLWSMVRNQRHAPLLKQINRYFTYGLLDLGSDLELWLQHDTERREQKPDLQPSLGAVSADEFAIVRSKIVANVGTGIDVPEGGRLILVHKATKAGLVVSKDLVEALLKTRSHRSLDRKDVEYDWRLGRFFEQVAKQELRKDRMNVAHFDFSARKAVWMKWDVASDQIMRVD
jgi:hypothetical protein